MSSLLKYSSPGILALFFCVGLYFSPSTCIAAQVLKSQTDVDRAEHSLDEHGVPILKIKGLGVVNHPAWTALYALGYAGVEDYEPSLGLKPDDQKFASTVNWLADNLQQNKQGQWVWIYKFDSTYNDVSIKAPWSSAFAQATGIQALLAYWKKTGDDKYLNVAKKAAESLFVPISKGGLLFTSNNVDIWFEEIPSSNVNPSHILNGHMRALLALKELTDATKDARYQGWLDKGLATLERWLPRYDNGYWLRYDLGSRSKEILFRFANPCGFSNPDLAVNKIKLRDPVSGSEVVLDVGRPGDGKGEMRIAGNDWGKVEKVEGQDVRRLAPSKGEREPIGSEGQLVSPYSYFYMQLPKAVADNLRMENYELSVQYYDERPGNLAVQMRSIAPGISTFKDLRGGDLLLTGSKTWREWKIQVRPVDLGYYSGTIYAAKHAKYLHDLASFSKPLEVWSNTAQSYLNAVIKKADDYKVVEPVAASQVKSTPLAPGYVLDSRGVIQARLTSKNVKFLPNGEFDRSVNPFGKAVYHPFVVADQLLNGDTTERKKYLESIPETIERQPALDWMLNTKNQFRFADATTYRYFFDSSYNDIQTTAPWASAFSQAYNIKALIYADQNLKQDRDLKPLVLSLAKAYEHPTEAGGLASFSSRNGTFFEEVPSNSHILNAHLISVAELADANDYLKSDEVRGLVQQGLASLKQNLHSFDSGYWLRYDQNPKKSLLFQIDWVNGSKSPLIDEVRFEDPRTMTATAVDVGLDIDANGTSKISGLDWLAPVTVDGRTVREFSNGYTLRDQPAPGGVRHNAFLSMALPESMPADLFDVQSHKLIIRYKDVAAGEFVIKIQAINEGNSTMFVPLHGSVLRTVGDNQWKEAEFTVRPQDMGWYKGADYQKFEVEQLSRLAERSKDPYLSQFVEKQRYFMDAKAGGKDVIISKSERVSESSDEKRVELKLISSSATYPEFGYENSFDGIADNNYTAELEGQNQHFVAVALSEPLKEFNLVVQGESDANYAAVIQVFESDVSGAKGRELGSQKGLKKPRAVLNIKSKTPVKFLRIEFSGLKGQSRGLFRLIEIKSGKAKLAISRTEAKPFLGAQDKANPLSIFRTPISASLKKQSDRLANGLTSDHDKVLRFMSYIDGFQVGVPKSSTPDAIIGERLGACGEFTNVLLALSAAQGMPGRYINLHNYPKADGHTVAEIKVDGKWRLYDPTYSAYYTSGKNARKDALSYEEIVKRYKSGANVFAVLGNDRAGEHRFTGSNIYTQASPAGVIGPDYPMMFPLELELGHRDSLTDIDFGPEYQGANYIGAASTNQQQRWLLKGLTPGRQYAFVVQPKELGADQSSEPPVFRANAELVNGSSKSNQSHAFDFSSDSVEPWNISFTAESNSAVVELKHKYRGPDYRYMKIKSYTLKSLEG